MSNSFSGLDIAKSALQAFQRELDVTGQNVSNVNTKGYSRQTVDLQANTPIESYAGKTLAMGTGVSVSSVNRLRDQFLETRRLTLGSSNSAVSSEQEGLDRIDNSLQEPGDNGVSSALGKFYDAWSGLSSGTTSTGAQAKLQTASKTLTDRIKSTYTMLKTEKEGQSFSISQSLKDLQTKAKTVADLNDQIKDQKARGVEANDLMDQRDQAVREISGLVNVTAVNNSDGTVRLSVGQMTLVDSSGARTIPTQTDTATGSLVDSTGSFPITGGSIGGAFAVIKKATDYQKSLDTLANNLRTTVNTLYQSATNAKGVTGKNFFNDSNPQTGAVDFDLDPGVSGDSSAIAAGVSGRPADGGIATQLAALRDKTQTDLGGKSPGDFYADLISQIGQDTSLAKSTQSTQSALLDQVDTQIQSVSGVSIDDEMANMLRFQRSYQAAAKALSVFDQTTEQLLGILR